jgi:hypothetical protein
VEQDALDLNSWRVLSPGVPADPVCLRAESKATPTHSLPLSLMVWLVLLWQVVEKPYRGLDIALVRRPFAGQAA